MTRPAVLHVCTSRSWGGMEMLACRLALLQAERGHDVAFAGDPRSPIVEACRRGRVETLGVNSPGWSSLAGAVTIDRFIGRRQPDILHVHYSRDLNLAIAANWRHGKKVVLTKHLESAVAKRDPWHRLLHGGVTRATAISAMIRDNLIRPPPLQARQIDLVHPGIDVGRYRPDGLARAGTRTELGVTDDRLLIGMMGRMSPGKGHEDFLAMAAGLADNDAVFVVIGGHSRNEEDYGARVEETAKRLLGARVRLTGYREDCQRYLNALDIFVFPSHAESFGLALVEAMATGLPCVAYGKGGVLDIINDGADGLLVRPGDAGDLRAQTERLAADPIARERLGAAAREKATSTFSEQRMLAGFDETYHRALS